MALRREPGRAVVEVSDDGPGIPEAELERVFEPFHRLEASRNRATGGVGLGLTIARRAVEAEGGTLRLLNRPEGRGLSAVVALPVAHGDAHRPAPRGVAAATDAAGAVRFPPATTAATPRGAS